MFAKFGKSFSTQDSCYFSQPKAALDDCGLDGLKLTVQGELVALGLMGFRLGLSLVHTT